MCALSFFKSELRKQLDQSGGKSIYRFDKALFTQGAITHQDLSLKADSLSAYAGRKVSREL